MRLQLLCLLTAAALVPMIGSGAPAKASASGVKRTADGHPDLSGVWQFAIDLPPGALKRESNGSVSFKSFDPSARRPAPAPVPGALPFTAAPSYKPEFQAKVKELEAHENKTDEVFYCGKPGVPRIGSPRKIVQLPNEIIFFYEDISGDPYRIIPTDGRPHRAGANPTYYGDSVGHWEGDTLVVDVTNFVDSSWFGEDGYFHSDAMHVIERLWRNGENLAYQVTVEDPKVLTAPWTEAPRVIKPSNDPLEESPKCVETDGNKLTNNDHHVQR
ncbi:MAG TPA: hypothetical protein VKT49_02185 [Bryobacteraceae bacterium]|nr:hypothetical protein [Bryobacteraceae bacterium]